MAGDSIERFLFPSVVMVARQPDGSRFDEDAERHPDRVTRSAADVKDLLREHAADRGFHEAILKCGLFYAPDAGHTRYWGESVLAGDLPIVGGGLLGRRDAELSFVHVDDAATAVRTALDAGASGTYHIVDGESVTGAEFFGRFAELLGAPQPRRVPGWLARVFVGRVNAKGITSPTPTTNEKFEREIGWEPRYPTYREGLAQVVETWQTDGTLRETAEGYEWVGN